MDLLTKIKNTYINNLPDIKGMERLAITIGCSVEYKYGLCTRWLTWLLLYDCKYILTHNDDDMRNYTA